MFFMGHCVKCITACSKESLRHHLGDVYAIFSSTYRYIHIHCSKIKTDYKVMPSGIGDTNRPICGYSGGENLFLHMHSIAFPAFTSLQPSSKTRATFSSSLRSSNTAVTSAILVICTSLSVYSTEFGLIWYFMLCDVLAQMAICFICMLIYR